MVLGHDDDLAADATRTSNRLHGLLTSIHPALERVPGPRLRYPAVLALLQTHGCPAALAAAGTGQIAELMLQSGGHRARAVPTGLAEQMTAALAEQISRRNVPFLDRHLIAQAWSRSYSATDAR